MTDLPRTPACQDVMVSVRGTRTEEAVRMATAILHLVGTRADHTVRGVSE